MDTLTIDDQKKMWQEREILKLFGAQEDFKTPSLREMSRKIDQVDTHLELLRQSLERIYICFCFIAFSVSMIAIKIFFK